MANSVLDTRDADLKHIHNPNSLRAFTIIYVCIFTVVRVHEAR